MGLYPMLLDETCFLLAADSDREFDRIVSRARRQAKTAGMKPSDIGRAVAKVRGRA
jgi:hypothetical protein